MAIKHPGELSCDANLVPSVEIQNTGSNVIGSIVFDVLVNNISVASYTWTGNLPSQESIDISLNPIQPVVG